ncbi:MAG: hypothetical protein J3R72DRAFT_432067, partial [Linnemannia gamsii]
MQEQLDDKSIQKKKMDSAASALIIGYIIQQFREREQERSQLLGECSYLSNFAVGVFLSMCCSRFVCSHLNALTIKTHTLTPLHLHRHYLPECCCWLLRMLNSKPIVWSLRGMQAHFSFLFCCVCFVVSFLLCLIYVVCADAPYGKPCATFTIRKMGSSKDFPIDLVEGEVADVWCEWEEEVKL